MKIFYDDEIFESIKYNNEVFKEITFDYCKFIDCKFENVELSNCYFKECIFENCLISNIKAKDNSYIEGIEFIECNIIGIDWKSIISKTSFMPPISKIENSHLKYNTFFNLTLKKTEFSTNEITNSIFSECILTESSFKNCNLDLTEYIRSDLDKCDFSGAIGYKINIENCNIKKSKFSFPEVVGLLGALDIKIDNI